MVISAFRLSLILLFVGLSLSFPVMLTIILKSHRIMQILLEFIVMKGSIYFSVCVVMKGWFLMFVQSSFVSRFGVIIAIMGWFRSPACSHGGMVSSHGL